MAEQLMTPTSQMVSSVLILGSIVIGSYYFVLPRVNPNKPLSELWFGVSKNIQPFYYVSIFLSGIAFIASFLWILHNITNAVIIRKITTAYIIFLVGAIGWSMTLWWWGTTEKHSVAHTLAQTSVVTSLTLTTFGVALLIYHLWVARSQGTVLPWWCLACVLYLLFHVCVLDNIHWVYCFLTA